MATEKMVDEFAQAQLIVNRAAKAEAKMNRKVFLSALFPSDGKFERACASKKLRKELCKEVDNGRLARHLVGIGGPSSSSYHTFVHSEVGGGDSIAL